MSIKNGECFICEIISLSVIILFVLLQGITSVVFVFLVLSNSGDNKFIISEFESKFSFILIVFFEGLIYINKIILRKNNYCFTLILGVFCAKVLLVYSLSLKSSVSLEL